MRKLEQSVMPYIYCAIVFLVLFFILTIGVLFEQVDVFNADVSGFIQSNVSSFKTSFTIGVSNFFDKYTYMFIGAVLLIIPKTRDTIGLILTVTTSISALTNVVLKNIFQVPRPTVNRLIEGTVSGYGYPSGHSMNIMTVLSMVVFLSFLFIFSKSIKIAIAIGAVICILLVGYSRIYLGVHNPTDVLGGYFMGLTISCLCFSYYKKYVYPKIIWCENWKNFAHELSLNFTSYMIKYLYKDTLYKII